MKKTKWTRLIALCLAIFSVISVVAANGNYDKNGDGKVDVWDLQRLVDDEEYEHDALVAALGGEDELNVNESGEYEIWSTVGLYNMARIVDAGKDAGVTFKLMQDIDLKGIDWNGDLILAGTLNGNGHVISNFYIDDDTGINASGARAQGFFAKIARTGKVENLKLENVTVKIAADSTVSYVGMLAGSVVGEIHDCTTVGTVIDQRTDLTNISSKNADGAICYIGALAGRIENVKDNQPVGVTIDDESILMTAESADITKISGKSQKVLCKMGMEFAELTPATDGLTYKRNLGIVGWAPDYTNFKAYNWQDISGACTVVGGTGKEYELEDAVLTARRQATVDKMYEICTVQWTPSQDMMLLYYKSNGNTLDFSRKIWKKGTTYYGMPYNHGSGSLERFYDYTTKGSNGVYTVNSDVPAYAFYYTNTAVRNAMKENGENATIADSNFPYWKQGDVTKALIDAGLVTGDRKWSYSNGTYYENIVHLLGAGFQSKYAGNQTMLAGETVESADHAGWSRYLGNDCSQAIQWAWREVVSSDVTSGGTVISGVKQMAPTTDYQKRFGVLPVGGLVPTAYSAKATCEMLEAAGKYGFYSAYAQASRGDAVIDADSGHSRMIAYDPICIRKYNGTIDENNSYLITHEQGGAAKNEYTTCNWDRVLTFEELVNMPTSHTTDGTCAKSHYYPTSIRAFHDVDNAAVTSNVTYANGTVKSNFYILSTTVDGNEVFTAIGQHNGILDTSSYKNETLVGPGYREAQLEVNVLTAHGLESLADKTVTVRLSNGDTYTINGDTGAVTKN